jgi:two-component system NtrC family response regulator
VRELENAINSAVIMSDRKQIGVEELHLGAIGGGDALSLHEVRAVAEKRAIERAMTQAGGNLTRVASLLGVSRPTLYDLLEKYDLKKTTDAD